ncbi:MAG: bifunctional phosphopantothenoylcysteine decarboxylase/phosphopantothenate--cysteine ligase CoaBC [Thermodesulfatator sp.]|nr:MAG: bifunctional phosphopantothenoylcysteine decarboxylase/phosphopantothenate--cysteine ligase CoaBC [Thermodesulfatator sp.]
MLEGRHLLLGVCGGIAAYKSAELARALVRQGAQVRTVLTTGAEAFVTPLLFEALTRERAFRQKDFLNPQGGLILHTDLAAWAEAVVVAPATASFLSKLSRGEPSDLLTAVLMAFSGPVLLAPAMNLHMWRHPATQENVSRLRRFGYQVVEPEEGSLACGLTGPGRLPPLEDLLLEIKALLSEKPLSGKRVLLTGGPTREPLDAVRFFSNPSSGRMAVALAQAARILGAEVYLVHGSLAVAPPRGVRSYPVQRAEEMLAEALRLFPECAIAVLAAAVCDLAPEEPLPGKTPKEALPRVLRLRPTPDIARELAARKRPGQLLVGFALEEREKLEDRARRKLTEKGFDFLAANPLESLEAEDTEVWLFSRERETPRILKGSKERVALELLGEVARAL